MHVTFFMMKRTYFIIHSLILFLSFQEREIHLARSLVNPIDKIDLAKEEDRLRSFNGWRFESIVKASQLAARGFYYLGESDRVQCVFCKVSSV